MSRIVVSLINFYQAVLSPDHSFWARHRFPYGYCRFLPSCSEYAKRAVLKHGALRGLLLAGWRVLRCNPFAVGGYDPVS